MSSNKDIIRKINEARKELLDLGLRNSLLNYRPTKRRGIEIVEEQSQDLFDLLVTQAKTMSFLGKAGSDEDEIEEDAGDDMSSSAGKLRLGSNPLRDLWLQTPLTRKTLESKLLATHTFAKSHIEERGVNILFLAMGMLYWTESDSSNDQIRAPLLLVPMELERTTALERFKIRYNEDEIEENISLKTKLLNDFRIKLPEFPGIDDLVVNPYFDSIRQSIKAQKKWKIEPNEIHLGFFAFGKYLMYKDLDPERWPDGRKLESNSFLRSILLDGFKGDPSLIDGNGHLDDKVTHDVLPQVLDADSTQLEAVLEVQQGKNIVIQGPPGTGKSQTITNIIANAIAGGKKILFVSEKMAALEVVKRRLDNLGLGDACLELHSHKANKKELLAELKRTWNLGKPKVENWDSNLSQFHDLRKAIFEYLSALTNQLGTCGFTPYQLIGEIVRERRNLAGLEVPVGINYGWSNANQSGSKSVGGSPNSSISYFSRHNLDSFQLVVLKMQQHLLVMGLANAHPFRDSAIAILYEPEKNELHSVIKTAVQAVGSLMSSLSNISSHMHLDSRGTYKDAQLILRAARRALGSPHLENFNIRTGEWQSRADDIRQLLNWGKRYQEIHETWDTTLIADAWTTDVLESRKILQIYGSKWWRYLRGDYRRAAASIRGLYSIDSPKAPAKLVDAADVILESGRLYRTIASYDSLGHQLFGVHWRSHSSDWQVLEKVSEWILALYVEIGSGELPGTLLDFLSGSPTLSALQPKVDDLAIALDSYKLSMEKIKESLKIRDDRYIEIGQRTLKEQETYVTRMVNEISRLPEIVTFNILATELRKLGIGWVVEVSDSWAGAPTHLVNLFRKAWLEVLLQRAFEERESLRLFDSSSQEINIGKFKELDLKLLQHCRLLIAHQHYEAMPVSSGLGQFEILRREFEKKRRHMHIRQLLSSCGEAIQAMKPVYMMSPISVASFLAPESASFDLVVFDEASQVKPVDALGSIVRSQQIVVVGDSKQLPPTSFFDAISDSMEDAEESYEESVASDMESILSLLLGQGLASKPLLWHYRSRHDSLIAVSNREFYENRLVVFPCPERDRGNAGLSLVHLVDTRYDRGRTRTNPMEAEAIAERVMEHANKFPHLTLGVAAFSLSQAEAILKNVEIKRRQNPRLESFFAAHEHEPFFVKNLETVQGDERDVILISIGYGRTSATDGIPMNFGALNKDGGERRLNVLITRARTKCEVFTNLTHGDIDLSRTQSRGVAVLKSFLNFAESGSLETPHVSGREADSVFEDEVANCLRQHGITLEQQVGSAGYFIDIAAVNPTKPGSYVLAIECDGASYHSSATARDRDRLRQQVLESMGWRFHRVWSTDWYKNPEAELKRLLAAYQEAIAVSPKNSHPKLTSGELDATIVRRTEVFKSESSGLIAQPYQFAQIEENSVVAAYQLSPTLLRIVKTEGPVHIDIAMWGLAKALGVKRIGKIVRSDFESLIADAVRKQQIRKDGDFLWLASSSKASVRDRSNLPASVKNIDYVAPAELDEALKLVISRSFGSTREEAIDAAGRLLGFSRLTMEILETINTRVTRLVQKGVLTESDKRLSISLGSP